MNPAIPQNAVTKLRILTKKSKFDFGRYVGYTIGDAMVANRTYIPYVYYNISSISFCDEILDELDIIRIDKPGTSRDTFWKYQKMISSRYTKEEQEHYRFRKYQSRKSMARAQKARVDEEDFYTRRRNKLQTKNHGG